jgi:hypothetical protein
MTASSRLPRIRIRFTVFTLVVFCFVPFAVRAYDVELDAGARAGSGDTSALGAASWNAVKITGPFAFGTNGAGEASLDTEGEAGIDAALRGDASYSTGSLVSGLRFDAAALRSVETGEESIDLSVSAPFTLNGSVVSLSFAPSYGAGFYDDESVNFGAELSLSYLAGDFVLKPGAAIKQTIFPDDTKTFEIRPSLGFVWYPGIPMTADASFGWLRSETDSGDVTIGYPMEVSLSAVPLPWLCITAKFASEADLSGIMSYRADGEIELIKYGAHGTALHLPIAGYYAWSDDGTELFGVSVMLGFSFGSE